MASQARSATRSRATPAPRRAGRPTREEAAQLDWDVREAALRLFLERGYDGTSMEAIASGAGTTKVSLYSRFPSKEAIFRSVLDWAIERPDWPAAEPDPPDLDDLEGALSVIAQAAVRRALDPQMVQLARMAITLEPRFADVARRTHALAVWPRRKLVVELLERHAATGSIVADDPESLAELFLGLVSSVPARLASFGIVRSRAAQARHTRAAVDLFLRALRP